MITLLQNLDSQGEMIDLLEIKGHGGPNGIAVGPDGEQLVVDERPQFETIHIGNTDVTDILLTITDIRTTINLKGCWTRDLAHKLKGCLDGASVHGSVFWVIGIPGTRWTIGPYAD